MEEIEHILTDVMFIDRGRIVLDRSMEEFESRYAGSDGASRPARGRARAQARSTSASGSAAASCCSTASIARQLAALGEVRTPSVADLFVAVMGAPAASKDGSAMSISVERDFD